MFIESSTTVYGRDISQYYYVIYMIPYCYSKYYVSIWGSHSALDYLVKFDL